MQREREGREIPIHMGGPFDSSEGIGGFGTHRSIVSSIFGERDPFGDSFFTCPIGSVFDTRMFGSSTSAPDSPRVRKLNGPVIEELDTDDEEDENLEGGGGYIRAGEKKDKARNHYEVNKNPLIEHPNDQVDVGRKTKDVSCRTDHNKVEGAQTQTRNASYQRVTYGGINGAYYSAMTSRRTGSDGVVLEESKQADTRTGQATHRISRGLHEKGHSLTKKLDSDGKVDTMQTLHNLEEDEFAGFEKSWKGNADKHLPGWNNGFDFHGNAAGAGGSGRNRQPTWGGWALPFAEHFGRRGGMGPHNEANTTSDRRSKKVVTINIE